MRWILLSLLLVACKLDEPIPPIHDQPVKTGTPRQEASGLSEAQRMWHDHGAEHMGSPLPPEQIRAQQGLPPQPGQPPPQEPSSLAPPVESAAPAPAAPGTPAPATSQPQ